MAVAASNIPELYSCGNVQSTPTEYTKICIIKHMPTRTTEYIFSIKNMNSHYTLTFYNFLYIWIQVDGKWQKNLQVTD